MREARTDHGAGMFWRPFKKRAASGAWAPGAAGSRSHRRSRCVDLFSSLGQVVDLSPTGAGVLTESDRFRPGMRETMRLDARGEPLSVEAAVVWVRSSSEAQYRVGLRLYPTRDSERSALRSLCARLLEEELDRREATRFGSV
jgi:hypothetical protein